MSIDWESLWAIYLNKNYRKYIFFKWNFHWISLFSSFFSENWVFSIFCYSGAPTYVIIKWMRMKESTKGSLPSHLLTVRSWCTPSCSCIYFSTSYFLKKYIKKFALCGLTICIYEWKKTCVKNRVRREKKKSVFYWKKAQVKKTWRKNLYFFMFFV